MAAMLELFLLLLFLPIVQKHLNLLYLFSWVMDGQVNICLLLVLIGVQCSVTQWDWQWFGPIHFSTSM